MTDRPPTTRLISGDAGDDRVEDGGRAADQLVELARRSASSCSRPRLRSTWRASPDLPRVRDRRRSGWRGRSARCCRGRPVAGRSRSSSWAATSGIRPSCPEPSASARGRRRPRTERPRIMTVSPGAASRDRADVGSEDDDVRALVVGGEQTALDGAQHERLAALVAPGDLPAHLLAVAEREACVLVGEERDLGKCDVDAVEPADRVDRPGLERQAERNRRRSRPRRRPCLRSTGCRPRRAS